MQDRICNDNAKPEDRIIQDQSIFIWIDILGFSDIVEDEKKYDDLKFLLLKFRKLFDDMSLFESKIISDGIILHISKDHHKYDLRNLKKIFTEIGKKQFQFILDHKYPLRGGISVGSILQYGSNQNDFISNGLARSYHLEATGVDWPVIATNFRYLNKVVSSF